MNIHNGEGPLFLELDKEHCNSLYHVIEASIKSVANEQRNTLVDLTDFIDQKLEWDTCLVCSVREENGIMIQYKRANMQSSSTSIYRAVIDLYTKKLQKKPIEESQGRYEPIPSNHPNEISQVKFGEPTCLTQILMRTAQRFWEKL